VNQQESAREGLFVLLPDGRRLGYAEYGAPSGRPVLFFHGMPGSSHIHADMADVAARCNVRLIAVDRPGYGLSDPQPGRSMLGWADDIAVLTAALGMPKYSIIGFSGGSPYALACAYKHPGHLTGIALVGPFAPLDAPGITESLSPATSGLYALAQSNPGELRNTLAAIAPSSAALLAVMSATLPEWDKDQVSKRIAEFEAEYTQTLRGGIEGIASDFVLVSGSWGFAPEEINTETHLWSGTLDQNTPPAMTHYLATQLPNSHTHILPDEGHLSLYVHWEEILKNVM
jgi:pimeloyl-ACP methyl ester carboxylesterase